MGQALGSVFRSGPRELFRGAGASALRDAPYAGLFLFSYEAIKNSDAGEMSPHPALHNGLTPSLVIQTGISPSLVHIISGASAGTLATFATHPFDVLKVSQTPAPCAHL